MIFNIFFKSIKNVFYINIELRMLNNTIENKNYENT